MALANGYRESKESWAELLRAPKKRGMRALELAVGDGALGFWNVIRHVFHETHHGQDWVHKTKNVLDAMQKSVHSRAKAAIKEVTEVEDKSHTEGAIKEFALEFSEVAEGGTEDRL